jgi:photosystem II stability/assembly factor-like uncharacterized protein
MKRFILLFIVSLLAACGGDGEPRPATTPSPTPWPTVAPTLTASAPTLAPALATAGSTRTTQPPTRAASSELGSGPLPARAGEATLGPPVSACAGEGLSLAEDGTLYTWGQRDGAACASAVDLATRAVEPADPAALPPAPDDLLEASDAARSRVFVAENGTVVAYDGQGHAIGPVLVLPPATPEGFSLDTALRFDETVDRLYLSYRDYDGQDWMAMADLATGETISDVPIPSGSWALAMGAEGGRVLAADADTLIVLDGATLELVDRLALSRRPASAVVDPTGRRLFVTDAGGGLHVLDATTLIEQDRLPGVGTGVDLDPRLARLYVGDRYSGGVNVLDLATLEPRGRIPQSGRPVASPADGRVYILEEDLCQADGVTLQLLAGRTTRDGGCEGCVHLSDVVVDPTSGQVYTATYGLLAGKPAPTSQAAVDPETGRAFVARTTGGYQPVYSLSLYPDLTLGEPLRWLDGLYGQLLYNPVGTQLYLAHDGRLLFLHGQTLELLGGVTIGDDLRLLAVDGVSGQLYAAQGERLLRFELRDALPDALPPEPVAQLPGPVYGIAISPAFAQDATLFVRATAVTTGRSDLYRSRDGGQSWVRLRGGLPYPPNDMVFGSNGQLYVALSAVGWRTAATAASWGEGVYVSGDGGATWRPDGTGLTHLRIGRLHVADDGALYALAAAAVEPGAAASGPTIWNRPLDQDWIPVPVPEAGPLRLEEYAVPDAYTQAVQAHWHELTGGGPLYQAWAEELRRSDDAGRTWYTVGRGPTDYAEQVVSGSAGVYWVDSQDLWRTTDEGQTWAALRHPVLADDPPFTVMVADVDGAETLFLGTAGGRVLVLPVGEAEWGALQR